MEHFPLAICDFQTTFLKTRIKATEVWLLATSAGHLKYWRYGKTREFRVKLNFAPKNSRTFYPELSCYTVSSIFQMTSRCFVYACLILFLYICFRFQASSADLTKKIKNKNVSWYMYFTYSTVVYYLFDFVFVNVFCYNYAHTWYCKLHFASCYINNPSTIITRPTIS
jgi:hypothetical protein